MLLRDSALGVRARAAVARPVTRGAQVLGFARAQPWRRARASASSALRVSTRGSSAAFFTFALSSSSRKREASFALAAFAVAASRSAASARLGGGERRRNARQLCGGFVQPSRRRRVRSWHAPGPRRRVPRHPPGATRVPWSPPPERTPRARGARGRRLRARRRVARWRFFLRGDARQISVQEVCFFRLRAFSDSCSFAAERIDSSCTFALISSPFIDPSVSCVEALSANKASICARRRADARHARSRAVNRQVFS